MRNCFNCAYNNACEDKCIKANKKYASYGKDCQDHEYYIESIRGINDNKKTVKDFITMPKKRKYEEYKHKECGCFNCRITSSLNRETAIFNNVIDQIGNMEAEIDKEKISEKIFSVVLNEQRLCKYCGASIEKCERVSKIIGNNPKQFIKTKGNK